MSANLVLHAGAREVSYEELAAVPVPPPTATWFPVSHKAVIDSTVQSLEDAGFGVAKAKYALFRDDGARMFATLDLTSTLAAGVTLAVGVRSSFDQSFPLGFCGGSRVFVCDNLAFSAEIAVKRKHTRYGHRNYLNSVAEAIGNLRQFREGEARRIERFKAVELAPTLADSLILRAFEGGVVSTKTLSAFIREWREPSFEEFKPRTAWSLVNAATTALNPRHKTNPQEHARLTMKLQSLVESHCLSA